MDFFHDFWSEGLICCNLSKIGKKSAPARNHMAKTKTVPCDARSTHRTFRKEWLGMRRQRILVVVPFQVTQVSTEAQRMIKISIQGGVYPKFKVVQLKTAQICLSKSNFCSTWGFAEAYMVIWAGLMHCFCSRPCYPSRSPLWPRESVDLFCLDAKTQSQKVSKKYPKAQFATAMELPFFLAHWGIVGRHLSKWSLKSVFRLSKIGSFLKSSKIGLKIAIQNCNQKSKQLWRPGVTVSRTWTPGALFLPWIRVTWAEEPCEALQTQAEKQLELDQPTDELTKWLID